MKATADLLLSDKGNRIMLKSLKEMVSAGLLTHDEASVINSHRGTDPSDFMRAPEHLLIKAANAMDLLDVDVTSETTLQ